MHGSEGALHRQSRTITPEVSPSTLFAVAALLEGCPFINGSPQNTLVPGVCELAERCGVPVGGDDFRAARTKLKSVLADFLISSGIKPLSIVSYNHLGNNDGHNLAEQPQFHSKKVSKRGVVEDMVSVQLAALQQQDRQRPRPRRHNRVRAAVGTASAPWTSTKAKFSWAAATPSPSTTLAKTRSSPRPSCRPRPAHRVPDSCQGRSVSHCSRAAPPSLQSSLDLPQGAYRSWHARLLMHSSATSCHRNAPQGLRRSPRH